MTRRGHGEGAIYKRRDGRWAGVVDLGYETGKRRRKSYYGATRREVQEKVAAALRARQQGLPILSDKLTLATYLVDWLKTAQSSIRPRTWARYEQYVRVHATPTLGRVPLAKISPQHLQHLYRSRLDAGLSATTVAHLHAVMHRALRQAERWGLVARNVVALVDPPRGARREMTTLSAEQARALIHAAKDDRYGALYVVAVTSGMRQGELLGLRWRDVDLTAGTVHVRTTLQRAGDSLAFVEPKTSHSRRQVLLTELAVSAMRRHRVAQTSERLRLGAAWEDNDLVFANEIGRPVEASNLLRRSFLPLLRRAGIPRLRFHDLRHTAATLMLGRGVHPKIVSEMLGHSQVGLTLDVYSHVTPTMQREAASALDGLLHA